MGKAIFLGILFGINLMTFPLHILNKNILGIVLSGMAITLSALGLAALFIN